MPCHLCPPAESRSKSELKKELKKRQKQHELEEKKAPNAAAACDEDGLEIDAQY